MTDQWIAMRDGTKVYGTSYTPETEPIGRVHIIHGLAEHSGRYKRFAQYLQSQGYVVTLHDQRGHGKTAIENGHVYGYIGESATFDQLVDDVFEVNQCYQLHYPELPVVLLGHSMGSFVARRYIQLYSQTISKVILSGTGSNSEFTAHAAIALAAYREDKFPKEQPDVFLNNLVFGNFPKQFPDEGEFAWLSRDVESVADYEEDEACGFVPTSQLFRVLLEGMNSMEVPEFLLNIPNELPILLLSGTDDLVGDRAKGVWKVAKQFDKANQQQVTVQLYEGGRHEMLQETNYKQVYTTIVEWMKRHELTS
ncbi:alpha/beta hydrolase [Sporosarcina sp. P20a]|uniref:alpha/beta hydrolase n=1 Tax=Sporosarcina sp. P20a TaxID=2048256 RepID=UPI000C16B076|nr:alpha/beta hydrolase [Sporosarcina sp. P20a]PIC87695.1 alpha/beta hydrolase [Sporosarcina sp. P20a]